MKIKPALSYSHTLLKTVVQPGDVVIDATVGNGHDTEFLAQLVGESGHVYGFDIQKIAIDNTTTKLTNAGLLKPVQLYNYGHERIDQLLPVDQKIQAATFNLGYLPGGNHAQITTATTTIPALKACLTRLSQNGIVTVVLYYGHPGGRQEKNAVLNFVEHLNQRQFTVLKYQFVNQVNEPPILIAIQKRCDDM
ncbi:class I SAM-dependent methyltransferase [Lactobacillus sp. Sy-1]|uniref:class I SAM-dependent methyltransferase n=1 Tax=Lactobacillus sp. Sy-1 TaxID=2109645 RepID=UPI001C59C669|nr:class I SAM-dependent methyltransferase [Lactobacillus sp. Sy-1]MBW1605749.1 SAM-dependent methyltransferase [Lactobacillus sp. Sy-1]